MSDIDYNSLIAHECMDWHRSSDGRGWQDSKGHAASSVTWWRPFTDPAQALRALEHFSATHKAGWHIYGDSSGHVTVMIGDAKGEALLDDVARAVCLAIVEAVTP